MYAIGLGLLLSLQSIRQIHGMAVMIGHGNIFNMAVSITGHAPPKHLTWPVKITYINDIVTVMSGDLCKLYGSHAQLYIPFKYDRHNWQSCHDNLYNSCLGMPFKYASHAFSCLLMTLTTINTCTYICIYVCPCKKSSTSYLFSKCNNLAWETTSILTKQGFPIRQAWLPHPLRWFILQG